MSRSLSSLADNLSEGLHSDKCIECKSCLDYISVNGIAFKDNQQGCTQLIFSCFEHKKNYKKDFNKKLIKRFKNIYELYNKDINKFILLLRKGVYPYEYMDSWERFDETLLPDKEAFYSSLNMENITDVDYRHAKRVFKNLDKKILVDYHDLYVESDTLLLLDVFKNFRNKCIGIYELDPAHFLSAPAIAWQACLEKTKVELELLTDVDTLLMVKKKELEGNMSCNT